MPLLTAELERVLHCGEEGKRAVEPGYELLELRLPPARVQGDRDHLCLGPHALG